MTESEWLRCDDPQAMFDALVRHEQTDATALRGARGQPWSRRKWRLFACASWRHVPPPPRGARRKVAEARRAVEAAERYADGEVTAAELDAGAGAARRGASYDDNRRFRYTVWAAVEAASVGYSNADPYGTPGSFGAVAAAEAAAFGEQAAGAAAAAGLRRAQAALLRCILGNPWRLPPRNLDRYGYARDVPTLDFAMSCERWLRWNDGTVKKLAESIYAERAFDRLPILADALEEAGCCEADILDHCRGPGPHARGCWAVDLLLGKE